MLPLVLFFRYDLLLHFERTSARVGEVFLMHLFGGSYNMEKADLTISVLGLIGIIFLTLLFADYIVGDLSENAEYIFGRYTDRGIWYRKKLNGLFGYCNLGVFLYLLFYIMIAILKSKKNFEKEDISLILCTYVMLVLFTFCSVVCINLLALFGSTTIGFLIFYSILVVSSMATIFIQGIENEKIAGVLHRINPMSNILVSWNFSDSYVLWGVAYYVILTVVISFFLWRKVKKYEIGIGFKIGIGGKSKIEALY